MDLTVNEYINGLLSEEAHKQPCDNGKLEEVAMKMHLPEWFDKEKYNQGRRFFWDFSFVFTMNFVLAIFWTFSVPSMLRILTGTQRGNSPYTTYQRYASTLMHVYAWYEEELAPNTKVWRSLQAVRTRHLSASKDARLKGRGHVSQRDIAFVQVMLIGITFLEPHKFGIRQLRKGDWEGLLHFWRTIGYMIGLDDRYNACRKTEEETREVIRILLERVFTPCLDNVPEYFEHAAHVSVGGLNTVLYNIEHTSILFMVKYAAGVPGYVYNEIDRIAFQNKLKEKLKGKPEDTGIDAADFLSECAVDGLPKRTPRLLYLRDFDTIETTPAYKRLTFTGRHRLAVLKLMMALYNNDAARFIINLYLRLTIFINLYFPYRAIVRFGFRKSFVNMFVEGPKDNTELKPNSYYDKPPPSETWYEKLFTILW